MQLGPENLTQDQLNAIEWVKGRKTGGLWMDVGTGKTIVLLTALLWFINRFDVNRTLVVGPRLVAERVWDAEVRCWKHLHGLRVAKIVGSPAQRLRALQSDADVYTITRDNLAWLRDQYIRCEQRGKKRVWIQHTRFPFDCIIGDESQSFKDQGAARSVAMRHLRRLVERFYLSTGSLIPNGREDAWNQAFLIDGGVALGTSEDAFHRRWYRKEMNDGIPSYEILPHAAKEIDDRLATIFHVVRDAQPPAPRNIIRVPLAKSELAAYKRMARTSVFETDGRAITAVNAGVLYGKLLQLANGAIYDEQHNWHLVHNRKIEAVLELLEGLPRPVIIGYGFVHDVERLLRAVEGREKRVGILRTGKSLDQWRAGEIQVGIMHPASAGHGLNDLYVSGATNLAWFGPCPNREFYDQLNGRLVGGHRRAGRKVTIHHLIAEGTIDEDALELVDLKGEDQTSAQINIIKRIKEDLRAQG